MPLNSEIRSSSFLNGLNVLRAQVASSGRGEFTLGNETVSIVFNETDGRFLSSGSSGGLLTELFLYGFNNGPEALRDRMLSMLSDSGEAQSQESIQDKISQCKFSVCPERLQCPPEAIQCPITLEQPEKGIFVKNSDGSDVCTLFDAAAFSRLTGEGLPHPLTREPITSSMIVKPENCIYDPSKGNFIIKDS
ncbi:DUF1076 domain-containing protein [Escherichia coli]|nr:DUF1076 domain-containing protein [Escherichia coli]